MKPSDLRADFDNALNSIGIPITIRYFTYETYSGTDYDEEYLATASGTTVSGIGAFFPIDQNDSKFIEEGKITHADKKIYITGSIETRSNMLITVGNSGSEYHVLPKGIFDYDISGTTIFKKCYIRMQIGSPVYGIY